MNREQFEAYCREHGWNLFYTQGFLCANKDYLNGYSTKVNRPFEIGMDLLDMLKELKEEDGYTGEVQGEFPFAMSDELL